ncbi:MAG TPA: roadblock/LC7 domain-containing protein [Polyangiaceae bacterium]|nr:roadblock/LC7 domain-containing protein [Polyangiaceae bacterium]
MENILKTLNELEGVHGTILADSNGRVIAYQAHSIYDGDLLSQASRAIASALDSVKLLHEDWESVTTQFAEGKLLVRNVTGTKPASSPALCLVLVADTRLNPSFAGVAIRVAVAKLRALAEAAGGVANLANARGTLGAVGTSSAPATPVSHAPSQANPAAPFKTQVAEVATSGLSWSGFGSSALASSGVTVLDPASSAALTACTKALARNVGPMAKVFVKEAVRKVCGDRPFSKDQTSALVAELSKSIEDPSDAAQFRKTALRVI